NFQPALRVIGDLVLDEIPRQMKNFVVAEILCRLVPREQLALRIDYRFVPRQFRIHNITGEQSRRTKGKQTKQGDVPQDMDAKQIGVTGFEPATSWSRTCLRGWFESTLFTGYVLLS